MNMHVSDFKMLAAKFVDNEIFPKASNEGKVKCTLIGVGMPFIVDSMLNNNREFFELLGILHEDMIDIDVAENYFSEVLTKLGGWTKMGITLYASDVHVLAEMAKQMA